MEFFSVARRQATTVLLCLFVGSVQAWGAAPGAPAEAPKTTAESAILIDGASGRVLFEKNADEQLPPASITKVMTMLLVMEDLANGRVKLADKIRASALAESMGGSQIFLAVGEEMTLGDLLKAIAVVSANDACVAVAEHMAGTEEAFVERMNKRARELGMRNTNFVNTNGLPEKDHYSSARDIALMSRELLKHPDILKDTSIWIDSLRNGKFDLRNTNELVKTYPGADGLKTGWTDEAGFCISGTAMRNGTRLVAVVMRTLSNRARFQEDAKLLTYGFANFEMKTLAPKGRVSSQVKVHGGRQEKVALVTGRLFRLLIPRGRASSIRLSPRVDERVEAPIKKGQVLGQLAAFDGAQRLGAVPLVAPEDIGRANIVVRFFRGIRDFFSSLLTFGRR